MTNNSGRPMFDHKTFDPKIFDAKTDFSTDYALIAAGVAASLIALVYLILV